MKALFGVLSGIISLLGIILTIFLFLRGYEWYYAIGSIMTTLVVLIILGIIYYFINKDDSDKVSSNDKENKEKDSEENNTVQTNVSFYNKQEDFKCPDLKCRVGPSGRRGPEGGTFTDKGLLMNLDKKDMVVDRYAGLGGSANAYLTTGKNYKPHQRWTLHSASGEMANKLENGYGGCLNIENEKVVMEKCANANKWKFTTQGTITPMSDNTQCLSYNENDGKLRMNKCPKIITNKYQWSFI